MRRSASLMRLAPLLLLLAACDPAESPPKTAAAPGSSLPKRLTIAAREVPEESATRAERVLFLPFENRTPHRLAPSYLRGFDATLAAFARAMLHTEVVDPELAGVLAGELQIPLSGEPVSEASPSLDDRLAAARRAGATRVVWGVLGPDRHLHLEVASVGSADAAPWSRMQLTLEGPPDWAYYDGPRQLLAALARQPQIAAALDRLPVAPDPQARAAFAAAEAGAREGELAMRSREIELAELALAHPRWVEPWVALASLRAWRITSECGRAEQQLAEGPSPARHIAYLLGGTPADAARLASLDWVFAGEVRPASQLAPQIAGLPPDAAERLMLAELEERAPGDPFALASFVPRSTSERARLAVAAAQSEDDAMDAIEALASGLREDDRFGSYTLVHYLERAAERRNEWGTERGLHSILSLHQALQAFDLLRSECLRLDAPQRSDCSAALAKALGTVAPDRILDAAGFQKAMSGWAMAHLRGRPDGSRVVELKPVKVFQEDRQFAAEWLAVAEVIDTADAVLRVSEHARGAAADPVGLLVSPARARLAQHLDRLIESAFESVQIVTKRGDAKTGGRYLQQLRSFIGFPSGRYWHARMGEKNEYLEEAARVYTELAKRDPYDRRWTNSWLGYVDYKEAIGWDDSSTVAEVRWLETLVPRTRDTTARIADGWQRAKQPDRALATIDALSELKGTVVLALDADGVLGEQGRRFPERIARIERALLDHPGTAVLQARLLDLLKENGDFARAESVARSLLGVRSYHKAACLDLADLAAGRGRPDEGGPILLKCIAESQDKWEIANLWGRYAAGLEDRGKFEDAYAAYAKAYERIGGAAFVLNGLGRELELAGRYDEAAKYYQRVVELYSANDDRKDGGRWELHWLYRRLGRYTDARNAIEKVALHGVGNDDYWRQLRFTYQLAGELPAFEALCRGKQNLGPLAAMSQVHAERGEYALAIELLEKAWAKHENKAWLVVKARILLDAGRVDEALETAREARAEAPNDGYRVGALVDALLAAGRIGDAETVAKEYASVSLNWSAHYLRAKVLRAQGRRDEARRLMQEARTRIAWGREQWYPERDWLPFEVSLGLPPRGSKALADLARRLELALLRRHSSLELWKAMAAVRAQQGDADGILEANARASELVARKREQSVAEAKPAG